MAIDSVTGTASAIAVAIRDAARTTGASFQYLLTTAQIESNLNPAAQASTSSAKGLYQFIDQTWLSVMKQAGPALGLGQYANAIVQTPDGRYAVPDAGARAAILKLRADPAVSAKMAGVFTRSNAAKLAAAIGRAPSDGELYIAHFLGSDGAARLIASAPPMRRAEDAAAMFPAAAAANRAIFYDRAGHALGAGAVYRKLDRPLRSRARACLCAPHATGGAAAARAGPDPAGRPPPRSRRPGRYRGRHAGLRRGARHAAGPPAPAGRGGKAAVPGHVHRRAAPGRVADRQQAVGAGQGRARSRPRKPSGLYDLFRDVQPRLAQVDRRQGVTARNVVNAASISMVNALLSLLG